jgi:hypothetical protein
MADPQAGAANPPRPLATALERALGIVIVGRLRSLETRTWNNRDGKEQVTVDAIVLAGNSVYSVDLGDEMTARRVTGHAAPWACDPESAGEPVALSCKVGVATTSKGPFITYRLAAV